MTETQKPGYELAASSGTEGTIIANQTQEAAFTNVYTVEPSSVTLEADKILQYGNLEDYSFEFELTDADGNVLQTVSNDEEGHITFAPIDYTVDDADQSFHYFIQEVQGNDPIIAYDNHTINVTVTVTDNHDGTITPTASYSGGTTFTNTVNNEYDALISKQNINGEEIEGATLSITGRENGASSDIEAITWESVAGETKTVKLRPGTYTLHESEAPEDYIIASDITFTVAADGTVKVADDDVEKVIMIDDYKPRNLTVTKTVTGNMGSKDKQFSFKLNLTSTTAESIEWQKGIQTGTWTVTNAGYEFTLSHGESITFKNLPYNTKYEVTELPGPAKGYKITKQNDTGTIQTADITAAFTNTLNAAIPTSADAPKKLILLLIPAGIAILVTASAARKKRKPTTAHK